MATVTFVLDNVLAIAISWLVAELVMRGRPPRAHLLACVAAFPLVVCAALTSLGTLGLLTPMAVTILLLAVAVALAVLFLRRRTEGDPSATTAALAVEADGAGDAAFMTALVLFGAIAGTYAARCLLGGTAFQWDDFTYHATVVAHWTTAHRLTLAPFNYHSYYPFNAELLSLWFMLPYRSDAMVGLAGFYWVLLAVVATWSILLSEDHRDCRGLLLAGGALLASPVVYESVRTFAATDFAGAVAILAAIAFIRERSTPPDGRVDAAAVAFAGAMAGLAAGCKAIFAPAAIVLLAWLLIGEARGGGLRVRILRSAVFGVCVALTGSYWYVRDFLLTGNPVFPAQVGPFAGPLDPQTQYRTEVVSWLLAAPTDGAQWARLIKGYVQWPVGLFLLAAVGYARGLLLSVRRVFRPDTEKAGLEVILLSVGVTLLALAPFTPFGATTDSPNAQLKSTLRYVFTPYLIGLVLFFPLLDARRRWSWFWWPVTVLVCGATWGAGKTVNLLVGIACGALTLAAWRVRSRLVPAWARGRIGGLLIACACLVGVGLLKPYKQALTDASVFTTGGEARPIGKAWKAIAGLPRGGRIAWFGPAAYMYYPTFGRDLRLVPCAVGGDGLPYRRLHEGWTRGVPWWVSTKEAAPNQDLVRNLGRSRVQYVLVTRWDGREWPPQYAILMESQRARVLFDDGYSVLLELE